MSQPSSWPRGSRTNAAAGIAEARRREIFLALVEMQDHEPSVRKTRDAIAQRFEVTEPQLLAIEEEGIANNWPPL